VVKALPPPGISIQIVPQERAFGVKADGPKAIDRHILLYIELVNGLTIVLAWCDIEIHGVLIGLPPQALREISS